MKIYTLTAVLNNMHILLKRVMSTDTTKLATA